MVNAGESNPTGEQSHGAQAGVAKEARGQGKEKSAELVALQQIFMTDPGVFAAEGPAKLMQV